MKFKKNCLKTVAAMGLALTMAFSQLPLSEAVSSIDYIKGKDRYLTAGLIAGRQSYSTAILVNSSNSLADGLSASGLAGVVKAPILLTKRDSLPRETELRLGATNKVYIIGSTGSVGQKIEDDLKRGGMNVIRIGGKDRYETSNNVANEILRVKGAIGKAFIANGKIGEADAMSISSVAARDGEPIILVSQNNISFDGRRIVSEAKKVYAIGGKSAISDDLMNQTSAERLGGKDRFQTNEFIIKYFYSNPKSLFITDGYKLVDALTGGPLSAYEGRPIVLVSDRNPNKNIVKGATKITAIGGVSERAKNNVIKASN